VHADCKQKYKGNVHADTTETERRFRIFLHVRRLIRRILRRIFGPTKENQIWRIKTNKELDKLIKLKNIINYIKAQRLSWFGHVQKCQIPEQLRRYLIGNP